MFFLDIIVTIIVQSHQSYHTYSTFETWNWIVTIMKTYHFHVIVEVIFMTWPHINERKW